MRLIDLPQINAEEKKKEKKLSKIFGVAIIITYVAALIIGIFMGISFTKNILEGNIFDDSWMEDRIAVDGVFYDKMGNSYEKGEDVLLYDEQGRTYTYTVEEYEDSEDEWFTYTEYYYVRDDGEKYFSYDCYITEDGWFYCDKAGSLETYSVETEGMSEKELDAYYNELLESADDEYKYYDYLYTDGNGNFYYYAEEASWNEKGELITAENDPTK